MFGPFYPFDEEIMKKVKCINDDGLKSFISFGTIYEVKSEGNFWNGEPFYRITDDTETLICVDQKRFVEIDDSIPDTLRSADFVDNTTSSVINNEDLKFFSKVSKGNCPCGLVRSECTYHK